VGEAAAPAGDEEPARRDGGAGGRHGDEDDVAERGRRLSGARTGHLVVAEVQDQLGGPARVTTLPSSKVWLAGNATVGADGSGPTRTRNVSAPPGATRPPAHRTVVPSIDTAHPSTATGT
jgi:hypothetical protein